MQDISSDEDVKKLVIQFYAKVRKDELLSPIFNSVIKEDEWEHHLVILSDFWSTILGYSNKYAGQPMPKHFVLPIKKEHFERWLYLFGSTVDELFEGNIASEAKLRANSIAQIMKLKMNIPL